ncbi:DUF2169 family type VI secretion system accessory protein [Xenorhabdus innexi]|uniref:Type VI secretion system protein n=1 Tax=Xenorhabdus innexi TaxID=290109 RepID=A0A1N6MYG1_9GAMM|nr:DUF2169 domain-containing protein [Xenorhabdus innexi]PHM28786.1 Type VI secretion system protein [Xenorhabdus innexi]SIP73860.1 conserved hypothetical protein [Xenorhabdus innexi]
MKIIKPLRLSVLYRPYRWMQKNHLGVAVMALADMGPTPRLRPEPELWQLAEQELKTCNGVIDLAMPKSHPEFLATGYAYTRHQADKSACAVRIKVDQLEKKLVAFGDRYWVGEKPSKPQPFEHMRLDWSRAFGGEGYEENPHGIGFKPETQEDGTKIHRLPNIETGHTPWLSPEETPEPASFCPLDFVWPRRFTRIGQGYDKAWLENEFPGYAQDIDWRIFNAAPQDQWWDQLDALPVKAPWRIENMHPEKPVQEGILPAWQVRCLIKRLRPEDEIDEEIIMRQTTVWFFPHREQMLLIWHGSARINEDDAVDVLQMITALEQQDTPLSANHYLTVAQQRADKEKGVLYAFREKDLIPEEIIGPWIDTEPSTASSPIQESVLKREQHLRELQAARLSEQGYDINAIIPPTAPDASPSSPPRLDELPEFVEKIEQEAAQKRAEAERKQADMTAKAKQQGVETELTPLENQARGPENIYQTRDILHREQQHTGFDAQQLAQTEQALRELYFTSVRSQPPALRLKGELSAFVRKRAQDIMAQGGNFSGMDFTGADLSHLDLKGANFSGALLESACFDHSQLDNADFSEAMLARASFCHTTLSGVTLDKANLTQVHCEQSDFSAIHFDGTQLQEALFDHCRFSHATFSNLFLKQAFITQCDFHASHWTDCTLTELTLPALRFHHAILKKVTFLQCKLENAVFDHARLSDCTWIETAACQSRFCSATLLNCAFVMNSTLNQADFTQATLTECNLRQMPLVQAQFHSATLNNSDLSEADCRSAQMQNLNAAKSTFIRTDLRDARLNHANLMQTLMQKCRLNGADLRGANVFRADLSQSVIDEATLFDGAYMHGLKTLPKRDKDVI